MTKEIPLSRFGKNKGKFVTVVDDCDFEALSAFNWSVKSNGYTFYACRMTKHAEGRGGITVFMHREIMNADYQQQIDHIDGNGLNNTRSNLRACSQSENSMNRKPRRNSLSGFKGVTFHSKSGKWYSSITANGKNISIGYFDNPKDAAIAYDKVAINIHGKFARLNFSK